jgi:hypothetical protein
MRKPKKGLLYIDGQPKTGKAKGETTRKVKPRGQPKVLKDRPPKIPKWKLTKKHQ